MDAKKIIAGATVAGVIALGAGGVAVASSSGVGSMAPEATEQGMAAGQTVESPQVGPGGKHEEKMVEMEQLIGLDEIGLDQAGQIATDQAPGEIVEIKLKEKDGYAVYEVETFASGTLTEFYINAQDGSIIEQKVEGAEESGPMAQDDDDAEMSEGPLSDDDRDDDLDDGRGPQGGPEADTTLPDTSGEEQE